LGRTNGTLTPKPHFYSSKRGLFCVTDCRNCPNGFLIRSNGFQTILIVFKTVLMLPPNVHYCLVPSKTDTTFATSLGITYVTPIRKGLFKTNVMVTMPSSVSLFLRLKIQYFPFQDNVFLSFSKITSIFSP
jgi:hypothetical protein